MAKTDFKSVDEYLATQPATSLPVLNRVRGILQRALPGAVEVISYQIPAYKLNGKAALYFAGWKAHYSLYPITPAVEESFAAALDPYRASKGTLRFALDEAIPEALIAGIAKVRHQELAAAQPAAAAGKMRPMSARRSSASKRSGTAKPQAASSPTRAKAAAKTATARDSKKVKKLQVSVKPEVVKKKQGTAKPKAVAVSKAKPLSPRRTRNTR